MTDQYDVIVIGAGVGGLCAAVDLARRGMRTLVIERQAFPGGKIHRAAVGGTTLDGGPTVMTMRWVFDELFEAAGVSFSEYAKLSAAEVLCRHAWPDGSVLDLFADVGRSAEAIRAFAGQTASQDFLKFQAYAQGIYERTEDIFIHAPKPTMAGIARRLGFGAVARFSGIDAMRTMADALKSHFADPRLRQLFARYATYAGNDPYRTPATFNLIAHVEQQGVWRLEGGMYSLVEALCQLLTNLDVPVTCGEAVDEIVIEAGCVTGVRLLGGRLLPCRAVVFNGDVSALGEGHLGQGLQTYFRPTLPKDRSLSALILRMVAQSAGFELVHHNVFFSDDYDAEFKALRDRKTLPEDPTLYVCAQDRHDSAQSLDAERIYVLVNAPATDVGQLSQEQCDACAGRAFAKLAQMGLHLSLESDYQYTSPVAWAERFPASAGALYGSASHHWHSTLKRPGAETKVRGLYLCGGSVHPGAGVPMAALSGRFAAQRLSEAFPSTSPYPKADISGGTWTESATTVNGP